MRDSTGTKLGWSGRTFRLPPLYSSHVFSIRDPDFGASKIRDAPCLSRQDVASAWSAVVMATKATLIDHPVLVHARYVSISRLAQIEISLVRNFFYVLNSPHRNAYLITVSISPHQRRRA
jgi:hypothetical protein